MYLVSFVFNLFIRSQICTQPRLRIAKIVLNQDTARIAKSARHQDISRMAAGEDAIAQAM